MVDLFSAGAGLISGVLNASAAKKAAKAQVKTAELNNALARELYAKNEANAAPYLQRGMAAGQTIDGMLQENWLYDAPRPTSSRSAAASRRGLTRSAGRGLDLSADRYQESPGYARQLEQGLDAIASNKATAGLLNSGSALKASQTFAQDLADQDYQAWADRERNQFNQDRAYHEDLYRYDQTRADRTFEADRAYGEDLYRYDQDRADRTYESDRNYATNRHDARLGAYFNLYGQGAESAAALTNAGQNYYAGASANNTAAGQARANGATGWATGLGGALGGLGGALDDAGLGEWVLGKFGRKPKPPGT